MPVELCGHEIRLCLQRTETVRRACRSAPAAAEGGAAPEAAPGTGTPRTALLLKQVRGALHNLFSLCICPEAFAAKTEAVQVLFMPGSFC